MPEDKILFLLPYPLHKAPSQRFRVENLLPLLDEAGRTYDLAPFMSQEVWNILYREGSLLRKARGIVSSYAKRLALVLFRARRYNYIFIHREAAPLGPPVMEWILKKIWNKKIIYDFDDAIWIPNTSAQNKIAGLVKAFWKVPYICRWSYKISAGNDYLAAFARQSGARDILHIPTVVDTDTRYNRLRQHEAGNRVIGWTGSHSTLKYLDDIMPVLAKLQESIDFTFLVIADKKPELPLRNWRFIPWNPGSEIEDLLQIDIGIMPLTPDAWSEGKCGFKLIQYLALGIPAIASPVGVNTKIIDEGNNGFIAATPPEWEQALLQLLEDAAMRQRMGAAGREKIVSSYSVKSLKTDFVRLFC